MMARNENQLDDFFGLDTDTEEQRPRESFKEILGKKLTLQNKLRLLPKVLSIRERYAIFALLVIAAGALLSLPFTAYYHYTTPIAAYGGSFREGILGEPHLVNPLLAQSNDADRDLAAIIFSGLMKYDAEGKLVPDLAKSYDISSDGLTYTVYLKDDVLWHDGEKVTADDVIFTVQTAQNPDYSSPLRVNWQGVDTEKVNDYAVMFKLKNKYAQFLNNLTVGILPQHLWQDIKPVNFALSELNTKPIGSGPFLFSKLTKDGYGRVSSFQLLANKDSYGGRPYIDRIEMRFYGSEDELINAFNRNEIDSISSLSTQGLKKLKFRKRLSIEQLKIPRYFAVFLNQNQSKALSDKNVRLALSHATDRAALLRDILDENGTLVNSPMIGGILDINSNIKSYDYDPELAKKILEETGWDTDADGIRGRGNEKLTLKLTTSTWPELIAVANALKEQWNAVGIRVTVETPPISQLQQMIRDRNYQMLLFGEILNIDPDPFSLWHSSQKRDPGLNLALYDNSTTDKLLEDARQTLNPLERAKQYDDFQKLVVEDDPAIFLYSPYYMYGLSGGIRGFATKIVSMPSDRFSNISRWYINTTRMFK